MTDRTTDKEPKRVPARASQRRRQPGAIDLAGTESLDVVFGDEAKSRSLSKENPLTGKPDAEEPPVRCGGRGAVIRSPYPYLRPCLYPLCDVPAAPPPPSQAGPIPRQSSARLPLPGFRVWPLRNDSAPPAPTRPPGVPCGTPSLRDTIPIPWRPIPSILPAGAALRFGGETPPDRRRCPVVSAFTPAAAPPATRGRVSRATSDTHPRKYPPADPHGSLRDRSLRDIRCA